jgi:HD-GYP domain-containing protein (c-di-GMP phosphodiesterase class II)
MADPNTKKEGAMLKRIAIPESLSVDGDTRERLEADNAHLAQFGTAESLPGLTDALLSSVESDVAAVALSLASQHTTILLLLAEAIDCRESLVPGSSQRVMEHAARFAQALGLDPNEQITLERGALLRDIGKLKVSNAVLLKDGLLDYDEWNLIQAHTHIGADLVNSLDEFRDIEDIVRRHHETWDGDGYPDRLEKEAIPFAARIVKIVDVYCAMTSPRPYREGVATKEQALNHLRSERGKHFDPELVDVFLEKDLGGKSVNT